MSAAQTTLERITKALEGAGNRLKSIEEWQGEQTELHRSAKVERDKVILDLGAIAEKVKAVATQRVGFPDGETPEEKSEFSLAAYMKALHEKKFGKNDAYHRYERPFEKELREKVMTGSVFTAGGALIPEEFLAQIIPELEARSVLLNAGASTFNVREGVGEVVWPRETSFPDPVHHGEGEVVTEGTPALEQLIATPHELSIYIRMTESLMRMSAIDLDPWIRGRMMRKLALRQDLAGLRGDGAVNQPLGIVNAPNVNSVPVSANGGPITLDLMQDAQIEVDADNIESGNQAWIMHARLFGQIRKLRDNDGRPLVEPNVKLREQNALLGAPVFISNQMPVDLAKGSGTDLTEAIYGRFEHNWLFNWLAGASVKVSEEASDGTNHAWVQNEVWFKVTWVYDWVREYDNAHAVIPDADSGL